MARESSLDYATALSTRLGQRVYFKREDSQSVFSFKLRGAYNKMASLSLEERARGVLAASAGNHAQGVALAASKLGCRATIVMPVTTPQLKVDAVKVYGEGAVDIVLYGDSYSDAYQHAQTLQAQHNFVFIHPFDDPDVIAGQGTVAMEILRQYPGPLHAVFVPIGGGGLAAGVATYIKAVRPDIKVIGVQTTDSAAMALSIDKGEITSLEDVGLFSDGTAVKRVGQETFRLCQQYLDEIICVDTDALCAAIKDVFQDTRSVLEPAGALSVAGLKEYVRREKIHNEALVAVTSGANINFDRLQFVAARTEVGEAREALLAVTFPEERGSFRRFCELLGGRSITEFNYRIADAHKAHIFVGIQMKYHDELQGIVAHLDKHGFLAADLSHDELSKEHIRHMVGGHSALAQDELLYRFEFPERPGALMRFLVAMNPEWNISLFHYRHQGADYGSILVGIQVAHADRQAFQKFLVGLHYPYRDESQNPAYRLFLS